MKKLLLFIFSVAAANLTQAQEHSEEIQITGEVINQLASGKTSLVFDRFDDNMKEAITIEKLAEIWPTLIAQCGKYNGSGESIVVESQGYVVVNQLIDFETTDLDIRIAFNKDKLISGLFFVPPVKKKD